MHTFSGRCDITPTVCCSFGGHSTPQFLQCMVNTITRTLLVIIKFDMFDYPANESVNGYAVHLCVL